MKFVIEDVDYVDIKAGDIIVSDSTVALICEDKQKEEFYMVNLTNGSLWSKKNKNAIKLIEHYFTKGNYKVYKSNEAKLVLNKR